MGGFDFKDDYGTTVQVETANRNTSQNNVMYGVQHVKCGVLCNIYYFKIYKIQTVYGLKLQIK